MLLPREKPFLSGLNSYYLDLEKFIQHLQGEIGTGCLYGKGANQELLIYFDEYEIVRCVTQNKGEVAMASGQLSHVLAAVLSRNFLITVYFLDQDSIFFWGQLPSFKRAKNPLASTKVSLPDLVFRLSQKSFSGFIEVDVEGRPDCAVLFFYEGQRRGGSYYWGTGGLSLSDHDYNTLLGMLQKSKGTYSLGYFTTDPLITPEAPPDPPAEEEQPPASEEIVEEPCIADPIVEERKLVEIDQAISEFIAIYLDMIGSKGDSDPLMDLKLKFIDFRSIFPVLDPYNNAYILDADGSIRFVDDASAKVGAEGIVDCAWMVVEEHKLHKKFKAALHTMQGKERLRSHGIEVEH
jgi:hypothetical protein